MLPHRDSASEFEIVRTIAFVSQKGGSGKSTLAANLAVRAAEAGEKVIALDLDPQASLAAWGDDRTADAPAVDRLTGDKLTRIPEVLAALARQGFTLAILDTPGAASSVTNAAMRAADLCLIPARPTRLDLRATKPTIEALVALRVAYSFVLSQCPPTSRSTRAPEAAAGLEMLGDVAPVMIVQRADFQDAIAAGQGVTEYAGSGKAADEIRALWDFVDRKTRNRDGKAA
ncbi:Cobyrinic acid ac-diamide synthase [Methylocella tundrae]|uniref:Cobyrinic acid ac-diamide synthase n=1 Tax=Methylocella tundrae TaxID=227605 RepID=A0A8B6MAQ1_METTU|nr:Cobyrinic acid ac-diamide synthase [Methylocella tundrae]VTZ51605.1 Cobyrinic acid ac-diamide synthase [Methylocella tundrae]